MFVPILTPDYSAFIDVVKPTDVRILNKVDQTFKLGQKSVIECHVYGSRPSARVRWFKGSEELGTKSTQLNNRPDDSPLLSVDSDQQLIDQNNFISERNRDINSNNLTKISYLTIVPQLSDNQQSLTCSGQNSRILNSMPLSDSLIMNVQCKYIVKPCVLNQCLYFTLIN